MTRDEYIAARRSGKSQEEIVRSLGGSPVTTDYSALFNPRTGLTRDEYIAARRSGKSQEEIVSQYLDKQQETDGGKKPSAAELAMQKLMAGGSAAKSPYAGMSGDEIYVTRKQEEQKAKSDFWSSLWDYLGGAVGAREALPGQQAEQARKAEQAVQGMKEAKSRQKEASKAVEWNGREDLVKEYKRLRRQALFDPAGVDSSRMQEVHEQLVAGDTAAGNGERSYGALDRFGNITTGAAENIGSAAVNAFNNFSQTYGKEKVLQEMRGPDMYLASKLAGTDYEQNIQDAEVALNSEEAKESYAKIDAIADRLSDAAAQDLQTAKEGLGIIGQAGVDIAENVLEMGFDAGVGYLTGGGSLASMFVRVYGQSVGEARHAGADVNEQALFGLAKGAIEVATEKMFDFGGIYGGGWLDDATADVVRRLTGNKAGRALLLTLASASQEGLEEVVSDLLAPFAEKIYNDEAMQNGYFSELDFKDMMYSYLIGMAIGSFGAVTKAANGGFSETLDQMDMRDAGIGSVANQTGAAMDVLSGRVSAEEQEARRERAQDRLSKRGYDDQGNRAPVQTQIAEGLERRGLDKETAQQVAELTVKQVTGQEMTTQEQAKLQREQARLSLLEQEDDADRSLDLSKEQEEILLDGYENELSVHKDLSRQMYSAAMKEAYAAGKRGLTLSQALRNSAFADTVLADNYRHAFEMGAGKAETTTKAVDVKTEEGRQQLTASLAMLGTHAQAAAEVYEAGQDADAYAAAMEFAANYAANGGTAAELVQQAQDGTIKGTNLSMLTDAQVAAAQQIGEQMRQAKTQQTKELAAKRKAVSEQAKTILAESKKDFAELGEAIRDASAYVRQARAAYNGVLQELTDMTEADPNAENTEAYQQALQKANDMLDDIRETEKIVEQYKAARKEAKAKTQRKKGHVSYDGGRAGRENYAAVDRSKLSKEQTRVVDMVEALADIINIDFVIGRARSTVGGTYVKGGVVYININAEINVRKFCGEIAAASLSHDLTHFAQDFAPEEYAELRDFVVKTVMQKSPAQFNALVKQQLRWEPQLSYDAAVDELVANGCMTMLKNTNAVRALVREHLTLAERFQNRIEEIGEKIKAGFAGVDVNENAPLYYTARILQDQFGEIQTRWDKAVAAATRNYNAQKTVERATGKKTAPKTSNEFSYESLPTDAFYADSSIYDYDFLTAQKPMQVFELPSLSAVKVDGKVNRDKAAELGMQNAKAIGKTLSDGQVQVKNTYTGRMLNISNSGLNHSVDTGDGNNIDRLRTNARLSAMGGTIVQNAIPINGLKNENSQANGTYAMACLLNSGDRSIVAIVTVLSFDSSVAGIDYVDVTHAISGRLAKKESSRTSTRETGFGENSYPTAAAYEINIADFLDVVNNTYRSILSQDVLDHYGETRPEKGYYADRALFQRWDNVDDDTAREAAEREISYARLQAENAALHDAVEGLKKIAGQQEKTLGRLARSLSLTKTNAVRIEDAQKLARQLLKEYGSRGDYVTVQKELKLLGDYILQTPAAELSEEEVKRRARAIASEIVDNAVTVADFGGEMDTYKEITRRIRGQKLSLDRAFLGETEDFNAFRKANFGNFTLAQRETNSREHRPDYLSVDQFYLDLQSEYGEGYFPNVANEGEQIRVIADMFQRAQGTEVNPFTQYEGEATEYLANKIAFDAMEGAMRPTPQTDADRVKSRMDTVREAVAEQVRSGSITKARGNQIIEIAERPLAELEQATSIYQKVNKYAEARMAQVQAEGKARAAEIKANERAKANEKITALKEHYQDMAKRARQGRQNTASRGKIRKLINELNAKLARPSENRYVPRELVQVTVDVLEMIDVDSGRSPRLAEKLADIRTMYEGYKADPKYSVVYDETVADMLDNLAMTIRGTKLADMTDVQLDAVYQTLKSLNHVISTAVNVKIGNEERSAYEVSKEMTAETRDIPKAQTSWLKNKWLVSHLRADVMFARFGGFKKNSAWSQVGRMLNDGQLKQTQIKMELSRPFAELINDRKGMEDFTGTNFFGKVRHDKLADIGLKDANGNPIRVTHDIMVGIYMDLLNEDNRRHFIRGGKTIPDLNAFYAGKGGFDAGSVRTAAIGERLSELESDLTEAKNGHYGEWADEVKQQIKALLSEGEQYADGVKQSIEAQLTDFDRAWIQATQQLMDTDSKQRLNETTMEVYGIEKARVEHYFPITTDPDFLNTPFESVAKNMSLENAGFMKERVKASNPTLALGTFTVVNTQIDRVAQYCGLMPALRSFGKIYNKTGFGYSDSVKAALSSKFGGEAGKYLDGLIADLTGSRHIENDTMGINQLLGKLRGNLAQTSLTLNVRVALSQAASYPTAAAELDAKSLAKALAKGGKSGRVISRADQDLIAKWSPLLWLRMQGYSTQELGDIKNNNGATAKVWKKLRWFTGWIQAVDGATVGRLWYATEYWVQDHMPELEKGTDAYYEAVAKKFNDVVEKTQPNYTTMQRATILREPNALVKTFTMFMTQRLQNFNIVYDSTAAYQKARADFANGKNGVTRADVTEAKQTMVRSICSQFAQAATYVGFKLFADALLHGMKKYRDDETGELTTESISLRLIDNYVDAVTGSFLGGSELYSIFKSMVGWEKWYGLSVNGVDSINDMVEDVVALANTTDPEKRKTKLLNVAKSMSQLLGMPLNNAIKIVQAVEYHIEDIVNGDPWQTAGFDATKKQQRMATLKEAGISSRQYDSILAAADTDGSGTYKQDEIGPYLTEALRRGELTSEQAEVVWSAALPTSKKSYADWLAKQK